MKKLGVLQPLSTPLESAALEEVDPHPQSHSEEVKQNKLLDSFSLESKGFREQKVLPWKHWCLPFPMLSLSTVATWEEPMLCTTELTLRELSNIFQCWNMFCNLPPFLLDLYKSSTLSGPKEGHRKSCSCLLGWPLSTVHQKSVLLQQYTDGQSDTSLH